jgi:hypothetical protein
VVVSGLSGHVGDDLAGVLYAEEQLLDLHLEPVGGFWSVAATDDFTTTEVLRTLRSPGEGQFPFVSEETLMLEPGTYTLVLWVDDRLSIASGWVPINTDERGLFGCQVVFDVTNEPQTEVVVPAALHPDGWNTNCTTGETIPVPDARSQVNPYAELTVASMEVPIAVKVSTDGTVYASFEDSEWQQAITNLASGHGLVVRASILPTQQLADRDDGALAQTLGAASLAGGLTDGGDSMTEPAKGDKRYVDPVSYAPGMYRLFFEAWVPSGPMRFGCEVGLRVIDGQQSLLKVPSLPAYSGDGLGWSTYADLRFPDCPS